MAIAFDAVATPAVSGSPLTFSHTCSGSDRFLWVSGFVAIDTSPSGATYNGVAMTSAFTPFNATTSLGIEIRVYAFYLVAPAAGTHDVVVTAAGAIDIVGGATSWTGVDQSSPIRATATPVTGSSATPSVSVTSDVDDIVLDAALSNSFGGSYTAGAGQTSRWTKDAGTDTATAIHSSEPGASPSVTMSWTVPNQQWGICAVSVKAAAGAAGQPYAKRVGGVPFMHSSGRYGGGKVWMPAFFPRMLVGPTSPVRKAA